MIKISNNFKEIKIGSRQVVKVCNESVVIWEKRVVKMITLNTQEEIQPGSRLIPVPSNTIKKLLNKDIISVKIGDFQTITYGLSIENNGISLPGSLRQELGLFNPIKKGTEIIIKYK